MLKVGIVGATGYTGLELVRILSAHPRVSIEVITSESYAGKNLSDIHTHLKGICDYPLLAIKDIPKYNLDVVFLALPHGVSMNFVKDKFDKSFKIIDLSGDFRLTHAQYKKWYGIEHCCPEFIDEAVYGLPELNADQIKKAGLVANPGCYPTSSILPLAPLLKYKLLNSDSIIVDSKSGVTGTGAKAKNNTHFPVVNDNFTAYGVFSHRHNPEIEKVISNFTSENVRIIFTPHLLPVNRGILSTIYARPAIQLSQKQLKDELISFYNNKPFVTIVDKLPSINDVRGSNYCNIFVNIDEEKNMVIMVSVIDNLVKGASGQAVQNMNIMFDCDERTGLNIVPLMP